MEKADIKAVQAQLMKLKKGGFFVYYFDKSDKTSDSQGHNMTVSKKVSDVMLEFKTNKKKDSKISRGTFFFDSSQSKFLFEIAAGDVGRLEKGMRKLASKGAPILKQVIFPTAEEVKLAKAAMEDESSSPPSSSAPETPTTLSTADEALLKKLKSGADLTDDEALQVLGLDIEQEIMSDFDQEMLEAFLSPDMSEEADLSHQEAFNKFKTEWVASKTEFNTAVQSIHGDIKAQAKALQSTLIDGMAETERASIETTIQQARANRTKLKSALIAASASLEEALSSAGDPTNTAARDTVVDELGTFSAFIGANPIVGMLRTYPHISVASTLKGCRMSLEKMQIQVTLISREITETSARART
ncbi:MAG: hypothetical protein ACI8S6_001038 [Myxococcota bacterium]|jgi:hypothetical protein